MIEIQCTSCHTRYRVDERVLPEERPTFKCSRCGHVFSGEPRARTSRSPAAGAVKAEPITVTRQKAAPETAGPAPQQPDDQQRPAPSDQPPSAAVADAQTREPLDRSFAERDEEPGPGENLAFDFADEEPAHHGAGPTLDEHTASDRWEVGEAHVGTESEPAMGGPDEVSEDHYAGGPQQLGRHELGDEPMAGGAVFERPGTLHSSGWFVMLFLIIGAVFGGLSQALVAWPSAGLEFLGELPALGDHFVRSVAPSHDVTLESIAAGYQLLKQDGDHSALVVSGQARNISRGPLHVVEITVDLVDGNDNDVAHQAVYCGNPISKGMIGQMTLRELNFFQHLQPPKTFVIGPRQSWPFQVVFVNPPGGVGKFRIMVSQAEAAAGSTAPAL